MPRKYLYRGHFGLFKAGNQPGLNFSDISDVSSDSDAPESGHWRPPSPGAWKRQQDEIMTPDYELDEASRHARNDAFQHRLEGLRSISSVKRQTQRRWAERTNKQSGLLTPGLSPVPRSPSPYDTYEARMETPITDHERQVFGAEIERRLQSDHNESRWLKRRDARVNRRAARDERVRNRILEWKQRVGYEPPCTDSDMKLADFTGSYTSAAPGKLSSREIWRRRFNLLDLEFDPDGPWGWIDEKFLGSIKPSNFYEIFLTLCPGTQQFLITKEAWTPYERRRDRKYRRMRTRNYKIIGGRKKGRENDATNKDTRDGVISGRITKSKPKASSYEEIRKISTRKYLQASVLPQESYGDHSQPSPTTESPPRSDSTSVTAALPSDFPPEKSNESRQWQDASLCAASEEIATKGGTSMKQVVLPNSAEKVASCKSATHVRPLRYKITHEVDLQSLKSLNKVSSGRIMKQRSDVIPRFQTCWERYRGLATESRSRV